MSQNYNEISLFLFYISQSKPAVIDFIFDKLESLRFNDGLYKLLLTNVEDLGYQPNAYTVDKILKPLYNFDLFYHPLDKRFTSWEQLTQVLEETKKELKQAKDDVKIEDLPKKEEKKEKKESQE